MKRVPSLHFPNFSIHFLPESFPCFDATFRWRERSGTQTTSGFDEW